MNDTVWSSAVIGVDGTIYFGSGMNLCAVSPFGNLKWRFNATYGIDSTPAINAQGEIIFGTMGPLIYSVNSQGKLVWTYNTKSNHASSPAIAPDGTIYIGSYDDNLLALNPDGTLKWSYHIKHGMLSSPALGPDGTIYMSSLVEIDQYAKDYLVALRPDGTEKWRYTYTGHDLLNTPMIASDGSIYLFDNSTHLLSITSDGKERWTTDLGVNTGQCGPEYVPALGPDGNIYAMTRSTLFSIDPKGKVLWQYYAGQYTTSPSISSDGTIYFGQSRMPEAQIIAINPQGNKKWSFSTNESFYAAPSIGPDGTLYMFGSYQMSAYMYAIGMPMNMTGPIKISTVDLKWARVNYPYYVDYETTHFNESKDVLSWKLSTNATWLTIGIADGVIQGTPRNGDRGIYWVNISVSNSTTVLDHHNFTLEVLKENHRPKNVTITSPKDGSSFPLDEAKNLTLEGSALDDDTGDVLNYTWYDNGAVLAYNSTMKHSFVSGNHQISLVVSDGELSAQASVTFKVTDPPAGEGQSSGRHTVLATILGTTMITIVIVGLVAGSEAGRYGAVLSLAPLYSKTRKEAILDNFTRGKIFQYVWSNPGTYFNLIKKTLDLNTGTVIFHLDKLETEGLIRSHRDGLKKRFYPMDIKAPAMPSVFEQILSTVRLNPGLSQRALSKALDLSPSTVNEYVHKMETVGQLKLVTNGNKTECYLGTEDNH